MLPRPIPKSRTMQKLILASTSPFRKAILEKLRLPFDCVAPRVDESILPGESPTDLVQRLARAKARAALAQGSRGLIIGSDQVAHADDTILGKPGSEAHAVEQLLKLSGKTVTFHTGLCLLDTEADTAQVTSETYRVSFRELSRKQIETYVAIEKPIHCAGSFMSEGLGIVLFDALQGRDPNTLVGLPLIALTDMLLAVGIALPAKELS